MSIDTRIASVRGRRVWDSRGRPTVEVEVRLETGKWGRAITPAGASTGTGEAVDLRDGGEAFGGFDVKRAVTNVNGPIADALCGKDASDQETIDRILIDLDGTAEKKKLGGNAMIATSMAVLHAAAAAYETPLWLYLANTPAGASIPVPEIQIFGGGAHAARRVDIQDFMIVCPSAGSFAEALDRVAEVYRAAGRLVSERGMLQGVADEGGYWPAFDSNEAGLQMLTRAIEAAGFTPGDEVAISLDIAASEFRENGRYKLGLDSSDLDSDSMIALIGGWIERYPIVAVEDPLAEDDVKGFVAFTAAFGDKIQIIGDDLLVTNAARIEEAQRHRWCNSVLIKPNQAGTVTETRAALDMARRVGFRAIISARSGETEDLTIAHLAVGWAAGQLKVGSFSRSERMAKWNEVLRIEEELTQLRSKTRTRSG